MAATVDSKDSPLRSLSSFKSEIPGGDGLGVMDNKNSSKSFHQYLDRIVNGVLFLSVIVLLVIIACLLVTAELLISLDVVSIDDSMLANDTRTKKTATLTALSATTLSILAFFLVEVILRLFSIGAFIKKHKIEIFDVTIVVVTFILDLVLLATDEEEMHPGTRAVTFLISLRLWRVCGIYTTATLKARESVSTELQMEKYARNQAEVQADALQAQCDQQLKEIAHLRDFMRQHSLDPDSPKMGFPPDYRNRYVIAVDFDKADTVRVNDRVNSESSIASAMATLDSSPGMDTQERRGGNASSWDLQRENRMGMQSDLPQTSSSSAAHLLQNSRHGEGTSSLAFDIEIGEEAREQGRDAGRGGREEEEEEEESGETSYPPEQPGDMEGITNPAFVDDRLGEGSTTGEYAPSAECPAALPDSPSRNNNADDEAQLRMELDEIRRLSDAALLVELGELEASSMTQEINGVPTTSL